MSGGTNYGWKKPAYRSWISMRERCNNTRFPKYPRYGGRGIRVCERWDDFDNFLADMGERPEGTSLDRIDNNGNYEPGNCRWATQPEQQQNRSTNKLDWEKVTAIRRAHAAGEAGCRKLAKKYGVTQQMIQHIVHGRMWKVPAPLSLSSNQG